MLAKILLSGGIILSILTGSLSGSCPADVPTTTCLPVGFYDECTVDTDCPGTFGCCTLVCGNRCTAHGCPGLAHCDKKCPYGLAMNPAGCPTCACYDPCQGQVCEIGETCVVQKDINCVTTPCYPQAMCVTQKE